MDFAKKQLEKYGWKEGQGLGKNENGISKALKPKLKFDTSGLGHVLSDEIVNTWWQKVYDEAAKNITTSNSENGPLIETKDDSFEISSKKHKLKKSKKKHSKYGGFIKTSKLTKTGEKKLIDDVVSDEEQESCVKTKKITSGVCDITEEELFKVCGGRTVHKGARHGLKMNAKLSRIQEQEEQLLRDYLNKVQDESATKSKKRSSEELIEANEYSETTKIIKKKKKRKKSHKKSKEDDLC